MPGVAFSPNVVAEFYAFRESGFALEHLGLCHYRGQKPKHRDEQKENDLLLELMHQCRPP
jgi:hypothetical protein